MGRRFPGWWTGLALTILAGAGSGEATAQAAPTLPEVLATALAHNPDVLTARAAVDSAAAERRIARALPNPALSASPNSPYQYGVSLPVDLGPTRVYRTRASGAGHLAAVQELADVVRQTSFTVRQAFYDILLAEEQRTVTIEEADIFRQLLAADSVRLKAGDIPPHDVTKSLLELARAEAAVAAAGARVRQARLTLQSLMGLAQPDTGFRVTGSLAFQDLQLPRDSLLTIANAERPDLQAARARLAQSRALRSLAGSALLPTPTLSLVWQPDGPFEPQTFWTVGAARKFSFGLGLTIPLFDQFGGERQRAQAGIDAAQVAETRTENAVLSEVVTAQDAFDAARSLAARYQGGLLDAAARSLAEARYAYDAGALSLLDLLDAIRTYGEVRSDAATALHDYWVSVAALARAAGKDIAPE